MIFLLVRTILWSTIFTGVVLWVVPAWILAAAGIRGPTSFGAWQATGLMIGLAGLALALTCVATFTFLGRGTPAPFDPPRRLVVRGPYRLIRNPMYLGAFFIIVGFALFYRSVGSALYALGFIAVTHTFVVLYEEPTLRRIFGHDYDNYCQGTGRWWPLRPARHERI